MGLIFMRMCVCRHMRVCVIHVEEFFYRLRCSPLYINMVFGLESMGGNNVLKKSALRFLNVVISS